MNAPTTTSERDQVWENNERDVLGAAMLSSAVREKIAGLLNGAMFFKPAHETIWNAIQAVANTNEPGEPVVPDASRVMSFLHKAGDLEKVGGGPYLHTCIAQVGSAVNGVPAARDVIDAYKGRRMVEQGIRLQQMGTAGVTGEERAEIVASAMQALEAIEGDTPEQPLRLAGTGLSAALEIAEGQRTESRAKTGLTDLDRIIGSLRPGNVIVCGARPGVGKSVFAATVALNVARQGIPVALFSLEMSMDEINGRLLSNMAEVNSKKMTGEEGELPSDAEWHRLGGVLEEFADLPLAICEETSIGPARISALVGAFKRKHPNLGLVVIDYLQLMKGDGHTNSRQEEVSEISRAVKLMAKRHGVPILLLSQLNRKSEERSDKRPQVSDLRESGSVEQDADIVILLHREDQYDSESPRAGEMDLMVEKNRGRPKGIATVASQLHFFRLANMASRWQQQREREQHQYAA